MQNKGATPGEWATFALKFGLAADLLPVVSDQSIPISPKSKMKAVGKTPSIVNKQGFAAGLPDWTSYEAKSSDISKWSADPRLGICLQTRNIRALDIDVPDADEAEEIMAQLRPLNAPVRYRQDSAKFLVLINLPGDYTKRSFKTEHGLIEFLATGQQCIVAGTHTDGARYQWSSDRAAPVVTPDQFEKLWAKLQFLFATEPEERSTASTKKETLNAAIHHDPLAQHLIANHWVHSIEKDGRLNIRCPNEHEHTGESSESATVYYPANTGGYARGHFDCKHAHCQHLSDEEFQRGVDYDDLADDFDDLTDDADRVSVDETPSLSRFPVVHISDFKARKSQGYHIKHVLPVADMIMLFGPSGAGKSFVMFDMAMAIARGVPWRDQRVTQGSVAYLIAEGAGGFNARIQAYTEYHDIDVTDIPFYVIPANPNFLKTPDIKDLIAAIKPHNPDIIIVDTWAQVTAGGNENSGEDMGAALANCRRLKNSTNATVVIIHHSGKDVDRGARGWSGLRGAADAELEVARNGDDRVVSITKLKDGIEGTDYGFKLNIVVVGEDSDGDELTSCVVVPSSVNKAQVSMGKLERIVYEAARDSGGLDGEAPDVNTLLDEAVGQIPYDPAMSKRDKRKENLTRAYKKLLERKILREEEGRVFID